MGRTEAERRFRFASDAVGMELETEIAIEKELPFIDEALNDIYFFILFRIWLEHKDLLLFRCHKSRGMNIEDVGLIDAFGFDFQVFTSDIVFLAFLVDTFQIFHQVFTEVIGSHWLSAILQTPRDVMRV